MRDSLLGRFAMALWATLDPGPGRRPGGGRHNLAALGGSVNSVPIPRFDIQRVSVEAAAAVIQPTGRVEPRLKDLADQASRAVARAPLNLEEGHGRTGSRP